MEAEEKIGIVPPGGERGLMAGGNISKTTKDITRIMVGRVKNVQQDEDTDTCVRVVQVSILKI